jgi:Family of unknown function (DUF6165)
MDKTQTPMRSIRAPVSIGELIDKISILEIKAERIADPAKLHNVETELDILTEIKSAAGLDLPDIAPFAEELKSINMQLWDIENEIRELDARQDFGKSFVQLARKVYLTNDRRAGVKQKINLMYGSDIIEEKSYSGSSSDGS